MIRSWSLIHWHIYLFCKPWWNYFKMQLKVIISPPFKRNAPFELIFLKPNTVNISQCGNIYKIIRYTFSSKFLYHVFNLNTIWIYASKGFPSSFLFILIIKVLFPSCCLSSDHINFSYIFTYYIKNTIWTGIFHIWIL